MLASVEAWTSAAVVAVLLVFYLLALRLTKCRVCTKQGTPGVGGFKPAGKRRYRGRGLGVLAGMGKRRGSKLF